MDTQTNDEQHDFSLGFTSPVSGLYNLEYCFLFPL